LIIPVCLAVSSRCRKRARGRWNPRPQVNEEHTILSDAFEDSVGFLGWEEEREAKNLKESQRILKCITKNLNESKRISKNLKEFQRISKNP